jgi:hypothetical protein
MGTTKSAKFIRHNQAIVSFKIGKEIFILADHRGIPRFYSSHRSAMKAVSSSRLQGLQADGYNLMLALIGDVIIDFRVHYVQGFDQLSGSAQLRFGDCVKNGSLTGVRVIGPAALTWHITGLEVRPIPKGPNAERRPRPRSRRKSPALL